MKRLLTLILFSTLFIGAFAQMDDSTVNGFTQEDQTFNPNRAADSLKTNHKEVPKGIYVWTVDSKFGDIIPQKRDTVMHLFMNSGFTSGTYGEYNYTGNLGAPRINRIATDRNLLPEFEFTEPYGYFITQPSELRFTNTLSPLTNLSYYSCGDKTDGEDHLKVLFANNINKQAGFGFKFDYLYGRGYYQNQNTALFDYTMWGSYLGPRYQAHAILSFDHMKTAENGGITNDEFITHPEAQTQIFNTNEIPVQLSSNWNRNDGFHAFLSHRYNVGFYRKVPMTEQEKEAKRQALKMQKEKAEAEKKTETEKKENENRKANKPKEGFSGRPTDAKIVGTLTVDSLNNIKKSINEENKHMADSLLAIQKDSLPQDTAWYKEEYVPVTSFIHTLQLSNYERIYTAYKNQADFFLNRYAVPLDRCPGDSLHDQTKYFYMKNTLAIGLLEGFNKYVPMGAKVYLAHQLKRYTLPADEYGYHTSTEHNLYAGAQLIKSTGTLLNYKAQGEFCFTGENFGEILLDGEGTLSVPAFKKDSLKVGLKAFYHLTAPTTFFKNYHSKFFSWDNSDFDKQMHTHLEGNVNLSRTKTSLRVCYDNLNKYIYLAESYNRNGTVISGYTAAPRQTSQNISLITATLGQDFALGPLRWENRITFQKSTAGDILPVPDLNVWSNLYLDFKIARVLAVHFGADARYFTSYYAPEYCPQIGQYAVQENSAVKTKIGNYPIVDIYANFNLKKCRFFIMYSHINAGSGTKNYFMVPHHPLNDRIMRFGLSWDFHN